MLTPDQEKALLYDAHISLTANAGSGKTHVLTQRYLKIVTEQSVPLRNIVAITFTELAAAELYRAIADGIHALISGARDDTERVKFENLRKELVSANVSTIHSFCTTLLREFPAEAGLDPNFTVLDQFTTSELVNESIRETLDAPDTADSVSTLSAMFGGRWQLENALSALVYKRENLAVILERYSAFDTNEIAGNLEKDFFDFLVREIGKEFSGWVSRFKEINTLVERASPKNEKAAAASAFLAAIGTPVVSYQCLRAFASLCDTVLLKAGSGFYKNYVKAIEEPEFDFTRLGQFNRLAGLYLEAWKDEQTSDSEMFFHTAENARLLLDVYNRVNDLFTNKKTARGELDFTDMILRLRGLLKDERVRTALAGRFQYIMIDEYQDTNETQYEIFLPLLDNLRAGNLFVVGDDKQSIYMFRNADLEISSRTRAEIRNAAHGKVQVLSDSFRMAPGLCLLINVIFEKLFACPNPAFNEVEHQKTVCAFRGAEPGEVEILHADGEENSLSEPQLIARRILTLKAEDPSFTWSHAAVLCRKKKYFAELQDAFSREKIPFYINGTRGFYQSRVVLDVCNYVAFLANPRDEAALIGLLRSPFYLLSDTELYNIGATEKGHYYAKLLSASRNENAGPKVKACASRLQSHIAFARTAGISAILDTILSDTPYIPLMGARENGGQLLVNLNKLRALAFEFEEKGLRNLYEFSQSLAASIEEEGDEADAPLGDTPDAVQVMTIHAAKGLQFPAVFIIKMNDSAAKGGFGDGVILDKTFGVIGKLQGSSDFFEQPLDTPLYELVKLIRRRRESAEEKRLLYVALTRAKTRLFVCVTNGKQPRAGGYWKLLTDEGVLSVEQGVTTIAGSVEKLVERDDGYAREVENHTLSIPVVTEIERLPIAAGTHEETAPPRISREPVNPSLRGSVITATQFGTFSSCPMKYYLQYILKVKEYITAPPHETEKDETEDADAAPNIAALKGTILHALLENISGEVTEARIEEEFTRRAGMAFPVEETALYVTEIRDSLNAFLSSRQFAELCSYTDFENELRIQAEHEQVFLQGRIDRLIRSGNEMIIVDYKSNARPAALAETTVTEYMQQLFFYAFLVRRLYPEVAKIHVWLIFLHDAELSRKQVCDENDFLGFGRQLRDMKSALLQNAFIKNTASCAHCHFARSHVYCVARD